MVTVLKAKIAILNKYKIMINCVGTYYILGTYGFESSCALNNVNRKLINNTEKSIEIT